MSKDIKTDIRGNWPNQQSPEKVQGRVPLEMLRITDDEPPAGLSKSGSDDYYAPVFRSLRPGQRLVCPGGNTKKIAEALKNWLSRNGIKSRVRTCKSYHKDGLGGVWWWEESN